MKLPRIHSLRQLLLGLAIAGLLPLAALAAISLYIAHDANKRELERSALDLARAMSSAIDSELAAYQAVLQTVAHSSDLARADFHALGRELKPLVESRADLQALSLFDTQARLLLRVSTGTPPESNGDAVEPDSLQRVLRSGRPHVGSIRKGPRGQYAFPVRFPVFQDGQVRYVLSAALRPDRIRHLLDRQKRPSDWVISVFDTDLLRVARSKSHESTLGGLPAPSLRSLMEADGLEGTGITQAVEGEDMLTGFARSTTSGWVVAVGAPVTLVNSLSGTTAFLLGFGVGGSLLLAALLVAVLSRRLTREIHVLGEVAGTIGSDARVPVDETSLQIHELRTLLAHIGAADHRVREALEAAHRAGTAKDEFLAVLSHELRNPLAPIVSVLTLLDIKAGSHTARERAILRRQVRHMIRLVDDLLDVSRLVRGKISHEPERLDLTELVSQVLESFRQHEHPPALTRVLPPHPVVVSGDPVRLTQVLTNVLNNALRHGHGKPVCVELATHAGHAVLRVVDQGEGMSSHTLERVFEPFFQARTNAGSLGLRLAIVKAVVERHGGRVSATSEGVGRGTTIDVVLPLAAGGEDGNPVQAPAGKA